MNGDTFNMNGDSLLNNHYYLYKNHITINIYANHSI